ncbi:MAG: hypothetical protein ACK55I_40315, partial [bacterium]
MQPRSRIMGELVGEEVPPAGGGRLERPGIGPGFWRAARAEEDPGDQIGHDQPDDRPGGAARVAFGPVGDHGVRSLAPSG